MLFSFKPTSKKKNTKSGFQSEKGSIFTALLGGVALVGILGATAFNTLSGPVATMSRVTNKTMADNQMIAVSKITIMDATNQTAGGDCDADGLIEPAEWRDGGSPPTGGGLVPLSLGAPTVDPWQTELGYCVWDVGTVTANAACDIDADTETDDRLDGADDPTTGATELRTVMAIISAGPDRIFNTVCKDYATAVTDTTGVLVEGGDDIVHSYSYVEAGSATSSIWDIKASDSTTAEIGKNVEIKDGGGVVQARIDQTGIGEFLALKADNLYSKTGPGTPVAIKDGIKIENTAVEGAACVIKGMLAVKNDASGDLLGCGASNTWDSVGGDAAGFNNDNSIVCDGTTQGQVRYNTTSQLPEFCDGTDWRPFTFNSANVQLVLTPANSSGMDITGPCTTDCPNEYGAEVVFTLQNVGTASSNPVFYTITGDTANFEDQVTSNCSTVVLAPNDSCEIRVKPLTDSNYTYSGTINITTDNMPLATMSGDGGGFGCFIGATGPGGIYAGCGLGSGTPYDLVVTPGNCSTTLFEPTCNGGTDSKTYAYGSSGSYGNTSSYGNGPQNTVNLQQLSTIGAGTFPAAEHCMGLTYNGYTDWYLPARDELRNQIIANKAVIGGFWNNQYYWSSTSAGWDSSRAEVVRYDGGIANRLRSDALALRCARREVQALPAATQDTNPDALDLSKTEVVYAGGGRKSSAIKTIKGITTSISVSVTGSSNPTFKTNGGAEVTSGTANYNDTIQLVMDVPTIIGDQNNMTLTIGPDTYTWRVGYADSSITRRIFVSNSSYSGNLGSLAGADAKCQAVVNWSSVQLGGTWKAILSDVSETEWAVNRIPWNWGTLENINGDVVADDWADLWSGSLVNPVLYNEKGEDIGARRVWTGSKSDGSVDDGNATERHCNSWISSSNTDQTYYGWGNSTGVNWLKNTTDFDDCDGDGVSHSIYCIEVDPLPAYVPPAQPKSCSQAVDLNALPVGGTVGVDEATSGEYIIDPDDTGPLATMQVYCDMDTIDGPWMLVLNYVHQGGTDPEVAASGTVLPVLGSTTLGDDESASTTTWGHGAPGLLNGFYNNSSFSRIRFECETSRHTRKMNFYTTQWACRDYARLGTTTSTSPWNECRLAGTNPVLLPGHSANLPNSADNNWENQGSNALTWFPFYKGLTSHWAIGRDVSWLCDGADANTTGFDTIHRAWIK